MKSIKNPGKPPFRAKERSNRGTLEIANEQKSRLTLSLPKCRNPRVFRVSSEKYVSSKRSAEIGVEKSNLAVCKLLVAYGADVNYQNDKGITPYYVASKNGNEEIAEYLRQSGADVSKMPHPGNSRKNRLPKSHRQLLIDFGSDTDPANSEFASIVAEGRHDNPSGNRSR